MLRIGTKENHAMNRHVHSEELQQMLKWQESVQKMNEAFRFGRRQSGKSFQVFSRMRDLESALSYIRVIIIVACTCAYRLVGTVYVRGVSASG